MPAGSCGIGLISSCASGNALSWVGTDQAKMDVFNPACLCGAAKTIFSLGMIRAPVLTVGEVLRVEDLVVNFVTIDVIGSSKYHIQFFQSNTCRN